jgi:hypothetical protein
MGASTEAIGVAGTHRSAWFAWVAAAVVAALVVLGIWAVVGRSDAPARVDGNGRGVTRSGPSVAVEHKAPPTFREGPNGEAYPAPRVAP